MSPTLEATRPRLLAGEAMTYAEHLDLHGPLPRPGARLIDAVAAAGLRGRGGAGFPAARKLAAVAAGRRPVVVVNGTEGEPMSAKDAHLLARAAHLVLDGALLAAAATGAREVIVAAPWHAQDWLAAALEERAAGGDAAVTFVPAAQGFVAGEETAVLAHLEGRPAKPRVKPPRPHERGYRRRPTLVQNVETLAHMALIARHGPDWFRAAGTPGQPGTMLVTLSGAVGSPGVYETEAGTPIEHVLDLAGGAREPLRALLVGGYFGAWREPEPGLRLEGAVGAGVVVALGDSACPVAETARLTAWLARESAGQCGPCVHGLGALAALLERVAAGRPEPGDLPRLARWTAAVQGRGACAHPDGAARMLASAGHEFADELDDHARHGPCDRCAAPSSLRLP